MNQVVEQKQAALAHSTSYFELIQRKANAFAKSSIVPKQYQNNVANCVVAMEIANRMDDASPMMVMQNLYIVHGNPAWSAQFIIARVNTCGRFTPLKYRIEGEKDERSCVAYAKDIESGEMLESPEVSIAMAKAEGWYQKNGSKWQTMPDVMLRYRSASFFGKFYAPDILMGMQSVEEQREIIDVTPTDAVAFDAPSDKSASSVVDMLNEEVESKQQEEVSTDITVDQDGVIQEEPTPQEAPVQLDDVMTNNLGTKAGRTKAAKMIIKGIEQEAFTKLDVVRSFEDGEYDDFMNALSRDGDKNPDLKKQIEAA